MIGPVAAVLAVAEIIAFVLVAHATSWGLAILLTLVTSASGLALVPGTARRTLREARAGGAHGASGPPAVALADGAVALLGCFLLVLPGFLTDALGLLMVFAPTRRIVRRVVGARIAARLVRSRMVTVWPARGRTSGGHEVIDGEVLPPDSTTPRRPE